MRRGVPVVLSLCCIAAPAWTQRPAPLDPEIQIHMMREGRATYWVLLRERADLGKAFGMTDRAALAIVEALAPIAPAGDVGDTLTLSTIPGGRITLSWGASCAAGDVDYAIYEGTLGAFDSHVGKFCSTGGVTNIGFQPPAHDTYYLVVPRNARREGSYGTTSGGMQRPQGNNSCLPQEITASCP